MAHPYPVAADVHLLLEEAALAEADGDVARARALWAAVRVSEQARGKNAGQKHPNRGARALAQAEGHIARTATDPVAWQVGLGALVAYLCAWAYALGANR